MEWISTPTHGYLRVKRSDMQGFKPSNYSRQNKRFYYLEEDCDAPEYFKHIWGKDWRTKYVSTDVESKYTNEFIDVIASIDQ